MEVPEKASILGNLSIDITSAAIASLAVAPIVTIIDSAVTEAAAGHKSISMSLRTGLLGVISKPHSLVASRPFAAVFLLYGVTYATANICDTFFATPEARETHLTTEKWIKLSSVSVVNISLSVYKDTQFAKAFRTGPLRSFPAATYTSFVVRDSITLFASFSLPPMLAPHLSSAWVGEDNQLAFAQLLAPAASQLVVTPIHLLGLDQYYRAGRLPISERARAMTKGWISSSAMRMVRVVPGLALGNVANTKMRGSLLEHLESH